MLLGIGRPTVLLPDVLIESCHPAELRLILAHEVAHLKRRDLTWSWLPLLGQWFFFFHPLVWLGQREWRPLTVDVRLSVGAETTVWSPEQQVLIAGEQAGDEVRLRVDGPPWDYRVRFVEPALAPEVHAEGDASGLVVRQEDGVTVVEVRGGKFGVRARVR